MADLNTFKAGSYDVKIGESLAGNSTSFHTLRYDFKPASVTEGGETYVAFGENNDVEIATLPNNVATQDVEEQLTMYKGSKKSARDKECLLLFDHDTGQFRIEKLGSNVQVKKTRGDSSSALRAKVVAERKKQQTAAAEQQIEEMSSSDGEESSGDSDDSSASEHSKTNKKTAPEPEQVQKKPAPQQHNMSQLHADLQLSESSDED